MIKLFIDHPDREFYWYLIAKECGISKACAGPILLMMIREGWIVSSGVQTATIKGKPRRLKHPQGKQRVLYKLTAKGEIDGRAILDELQYGQPQSKMTFYDDPALMYRLYEQQRRAQKKANGGTASAADIERIRKQQNDVCAYFSVCGNGLYEGFHIDHIIPVSKGGSGNAANLQLTCPQCNRSKNAADPLVFARKIGMLL